MTIPADSTFPTFIAIGVILFVGAFMAWLTRNAAARGEVRVGPREKPAPKYALLECDCGVDTPCPQGRDPNINPHRCKVPKVVHEGVISRQHGVLE